MLAVAFTMAPLPASLVERWYADGIYGGLQPRLTALTDLFPWAVMDLLILGGGVGAIIVGLARRRRNRACRSQGRARRWFRAAGSILLGASAVYLLFLMLWGFNYRRAPVERRLDFDESRVSAQGVVDLAREATAALNALHAPAHAVPWPGSEDLPRQFGPRLDEVARQLGLPWTPRAGRPKRTLLGLYFRWASIAGVTNPFGLEVIPSPDALPFERHSIVAHEWAHLAGFAHEDEANFVGWLMCVYGDAQARYSGWLGVWPVLVSVAPPTEQESLTRALADGPRADLRAIAERQRRALPLVRRAAWRSYDAFLRSQHVPEGVESYEGVVRLMAGTRLAPR